MKRRKRVLSPNELNKLLTDLIKLRRELLSKEASIDDIKKYLDELSQKTIESMLTSDKMKKVLEKFKLDDLSSIKDEDMSFFVESVSNIIEDMSKKTEVEDNSLATDFSSLDIAYNKDSTADFADNSDLEDDNAQSPHDMHTEDGEFNETTNDQLIERVLGVKPLWEL